MSRLRNEAPLIAPVERCADGTFVVRSPGVGRWTGGPEPGELVGEGSRIGTLRQLNRVFAIAVGPGGAGRVADGAHRPWAEFVEHGQALIRLTALREDAAGDDAASTGAAGPAAGGRAVPAPTDGVFYRRPAPDRPEFVQVGDRVQPGQPIGLIEVMKTFNQIAYEGPAAEVVELRAADGAEVRAGDPLLIVREA